MRSETIIGAYEKINSLVTTSENLRKKYAEWLQVAVAGKEELQNQIFEKEQNKKLTHISYGII